MKLSRFVFGFGLTALILTLSVISLSAPASAGVAIGISVGVAPPAIPVYEQPACPGAGYLWTPGYWAWNEDGGYYWVPGTWVVAPVGMVWTPGYWGSERGRYGWHAGYWGPHVGFYGGVNYGFGYGGVGFEGGEWRGRTFFYNRAVLNVNVGLVRNVYSRNVIVNNVHVSYNGPGGVLVRPSREEERWEHEPHRMALQEQRHHEFEAGHNREFFASANHGHPGIAATGRPGEFHGAHFDHASDRGEMRGNHGFDRGERNDRGNDRHFDNRHSEDRHFDNHRGNERHGDDHRSDRPAPRADHHEQSKHGRDR